LLKKTGTSFAISGFRIIVVTMPGTAADITQSIPLRPETEKEKIRINATYPTIFY